MNKRGRPKGDNNKDTVFTFRFDQDLVNRLERYCELFEMTKSDVVREAIDEYTKNIDRNDVDDV